MPKHFTPFKSQIIESRETNKPVVTHVEIPMHSLGNGWKRGIVELAEGDTAVNPQSTKPERILRGPMVVVYDMHPTSLTAATYDDAGGFYNALRHCNPVQRHNLVAVIDKIKTDDKQLDTDEYVGLVLDALDIRDN